MQVAMAKKRKPRPNRDHAHQNQRPDASDEVIAKQLEELLTPAIDAQASHYKRLGLRARILTPVDGGCGAHLTVARCTQCEGINPDACA